MADRQVTVTLHNSLGRITIDADTKRLLLEGSTTVVETGLVVDYYAEDVTDLLSPEQLAAAGLLYEAALAWADAHT